MAKVVDNCAKVLCATCLSQPPFFLCACKVEVSLPKLQWCSAVVVAAEFCGCSMEVSQCKSILFINGG